MFTIQDATIADVTAINAITTKAFTLYQTALNSNTAVYSSIETNEKIENDIKNHRVFVAKNKDGIVLGSIRYCMLSSDLAYIFRFGVDPDINNTGIGSQLLATVIAECEQKQVTTIALHTNARYYKLARYYYGKAFFVHSTETSKGYIRALFIKELTKKNYDISPAFKK